jgi:hypothetical protein
VSFPALQVLSPCCLDVLSCVLTLSCEVCVLSKLTHSANMPGAGRGNKKKCRSCRRNVKGHHGPHGALCALTPLSPPAKTATASSMPTSLVDGENTSSASQPPTTQGCSDVEAHLTQPAQLVPGLFSSNVPPTLDLTPADSMAQAQQTWSLSTLPQHQPKYSTTHAATHAGPAVSLPQPSYTSSPSTANTLSTGQVSQSMLPQTLLNRDLTKNAAMGLPLRATQHSSPQLINNVNTVNAGLGYSVPVMPINATNTSSQAVTNDITVMLLQQMSNIGSKLEQVATCQQWLTERVASLPQAPTAATAHQQGPTIMPAQLSTTSLPAMQPPGVMQQSIYSMPVGTHTKPALPGLRNDVDNVNDFKAMSPVEGLTEATIKSALKGEFVYLDHFLLNVALSQEGLGELQQFIDTEGQVSYRPKRAKRKINNIQTWLEAWSNYEKLLISYHGMHLYDTMWEYRKFICECDRKFNWASVAVYDIRHRAKLSRKSVNFSEPDVDIQSQVLDSTAIKSGASRCYRCKSFDHTVSECPFPQVAPKGAQMQAKVKKGDGSVSSQGNSYQVCRNFNGLRCVLTSCPRRHECRSCHGDLPYDLCIKSGPCSGSNQITPKT